MDIHTIIALINSDEQLQADYELHHDQDTSGSAYCTQKSPTNTPCSDIFSTTRSGQSSVIFFSFGKHVQDKHFFCFYHFLFIVFYFTGPKKVGNPDRGSTSNETCKHNLRKQTIAVKDECACGKIVCCGHMYMYSMPLVSQLLMKE